MLRKQVSRAVQQFVQKRTLFNTKALLPGFVTREQILDAPSTPLISPSYPKGPYTFLNREYFIIAYESDLELVKKVIPQPLRPASNVVLYEWIRMPDSTGFGDYQESGAVIPCIAPNGEHVNYTAMMFLDCEPPIAAGREVWGFPKKYANPQFGVVRDTIVGTLTYNNAPVAVGTMAYKYKKIAEEDAIKSLTKTSVNLKIIPDVDFSIALAKLVKYNLCNVNLKFAYEGPARLQLTPHINAPAASLPVRKVLYGKHILADITLPYGDVMHNYLSNDVEQPKDDPAYLTRNEILNSKHSMPYLAPSYSLHPSHLQNREYFVIKYETTQDALRKVIPDMLYPNEQNLVYLNWIKTEGTGLGDYEKVQLIVPVTDKNGKQFNFEVMSILNGSSPITAGREIYGQPQKFGQPKLAVSHDTVNGTLDYCGVRVANATMSYKNKKMNKNDALAYLSTPYLNLKKIPTVKGDCAIAQLVELQHTNINVSSCYESPASLQLLPHVNAPFEDFPVVKILGGYSIVCDLVLPAGKVYHDYLVE